MTEICCRYFSCIALWVGGKCRGARYMQTDLDGSLYISRAIAQQSFGDADILKLAIVTTRRSR